MKYWTGAVCALSLTFALAACAQPDDTATAEATTGGTIEGTWVGQIDSLQDDQVRNYMIADGTYTCNHCTPAYSVPASGEFETVDRPGADGVMVKVVDDNTIEFAVRNEGEELNKSTWKVSEDGETMTVTSTDMSGDEPVTATTTFTRASAAPEGAHAASGEWKFASLSDMDEAAVTFTFAIDGDQMTETGQEGSVTRTIGGEPVTPEWSTTGAATAVEKLSDTSYLFTTTLDGEVVGTTEMTVDGDTLTGKSTDPRSGSTSSWKAKRKTT
jgi:hypothetical protein